MNPGAGQVWSALRLQMVDASEDEVPRVNRAGPGGESGGTWVRKRIMGRERAMRLKGLIMAAEESV